MLNSFMLEALCFNTSSSVNCTSESFSVDRELIRQINKDRILTFNRASKNTNKDKNNLLGQINSIVSSKMNQISRYNTNNYSKPYRDIKTIPEKILDAPNLLDDYYLNILDWGSQDILAICLGQNLYLWNSQTNQTTFLYKDIANICSVNWMSNGVCLAVGLNDGTIALYDVEKKVRMRTMEGHQSRVPSLSWNHYILSSGEKKGIIFNHDVREKHHIFSVLKGHTKEVCQLKWSLDGDFLASGGNDNTVNIWEVNTSRAFRPLTQLKLDFDDIDRVPTYDVYSPKFSLNQHSSAVKALAWCPYQRNILISGGGTKDKSIKIWNTDNGSLINSFNTGSQVCCLMLNKYEKEIISSHGYSKNQISIWSYPKMKKITELTGHMNRVLYMGMSPDGSTIVSGAADETLRFWMINDIDKINETQGDNGRSRFIPEFNQEKNQNNILTEMNIR